MAESGGRKPPDGESGEDKDNAAQRDGSAQSTGSNTQDGRHNTENKPLTGRKEETQKRKHPSVLVKEDGKAKTGKFISERKGPFEKEDKARKTKVEMKTSASKRKEVDIEIENGSVKKPDETDYASYKSETDGDFPGNTSEDLFSSYVFIEENDTTTCSLDPATVKTKEEETKSSDETRTTNDSTNDENIEIDDEEKETPDQNIGVKDENKERTNEYKKSLEGSVNAETVEMKKEETEASDETVTTNDKNKEKPDENKGIKDENKEISDKDQERLEENMETSNGNKPTGMTIFVSTLTGKRIAIHVQSNDYVKIVKSKIRRNMDILPEKQKLILNNTELEDGKTLLDYDIPDRSTVHMVVKSQENADTPPEDENSKETLENTAAASNVSKSAIRKRKKNRRSDEIQAQASAENIKGEKQDIVKVTQGLEARKAGQATQLQVNQEENREDADTPPEDENSRETLEKSAAASEVSKSTKRERKEERKKKDAMTKHSEQPLPSEVMEIKISVKKTEVQEQASADKERDDKQDTVMDKKDLESAKDVLTTQMQVDNEESLEATDVTEHANSPSSGIENRSQNDELDEARNEFSAARSKSIKEETSEEKEANNMVENYSKQDEYEKKKKAAKKQLTVNSVESSHETQKEANKRGMVNPAGQSKPVAVLEVNQEKGILNPEGQSRPVPPPRPSKIVKVPSPEENREEFDSELMKTSADKDKGYERDTYETPWAYIENPLNSLEDRESVHRACKYWENHTYARLEPAVQLCWEKVFRTALVKIKSNVILKPTVLLARLFHE